MLKKILAASTASVLALTALAATAMADEADGADITITNPVKYVDVTLTAELTPAQIAQLIGDADADGEVTAAEIDETYIVKSDDDLKNSYSNILLSIWTDTDVNMGTDFSFKGGTVDFKLQGELKDLYLVQNGTTSFDVTDRTAGPTTAFVTTTPDFANVAGNGVANAPGYAVDLAPNYDTGAIVVDNGGGIVADLGSKGGPAGYVINTKTGALLGWTDKNPAKGIYDKNFEKEYTIADSVAWLASTNTTTGKASSPIVINANYGLSATTVLTGIDFDDSKVKVSFTIRGKADKWATLLTGNQVSANGTWNWNGTTWSNVDALLASAAAKTGIANKFGIVGESGTNNGGWQHLAGLSQKITCDFVKTEDSVDEELPLRAAVPVGVGQNANIPTLQKMNNGGKMKFHFDTDLSSAVVVGTVIFYGTSGQVALPVGTDYSWEDSGKTLVMDFPADLTYDPSMTNKFNSFKATYDINVQATSGYFTITDLLGTGTNFPDRDTWGGKLKKITFHANAEKAPNQGGLVDNNSSDNSTSTPTNSGNSNKGDETNPGTGVAVAVAPVVLAVAGAAVVISKKRK